RSTIGCCCTDWGHWCHSAFPCWWAPRGNGSSAGCWLTGMVNRGPRRTVRMPLPRCRRWPRRRAPGGFGCMMSVPRWTRSPWRPRGWRAMSEAARRCDTTADRITLTGLRVFGWHGVLEHERADGQEFLVDLVAWFDLRAAAESDQLEHTVHYGEMAERVAVIVGGRPYNLIEALAGRIGDELLAAWPLRAVEVTVHKPAAPIPLDFADVAVTVLRERQEPCSGAEA